MKEYIELITVIISLVITIFSFFNENKKNKNLISEIEKRVNNNQNQHFSDISTSGDNSRIDISSNQTIVNIPEEIINHQVNEIETENFRKDVLDFKTSQLLFFTFLFVMSCIFSYFQVKNTSPFDFSNFFVLLFYFYSFLISFLSVGLIFIRFYQQFSIQRFKYSVKYYSTFIEKIIRFFQFYFAPLIYLTFQIAFIKFLISLNIDKENFLTTTFLKSFIYLVANIYFYNFFAHQIIFNNVIKYKYVIKRLLLLIIITISIYWIIQDSFFLYLLNKIIQVIKP